MNDDFFGSLTDEELMLLLNETPTDVDDSIKRQIKSKALFKAGFKEKKIIHFPFRAVSVAAACLCVLLSVLLVYVLKSGSNSPSVQVSTTQSSALQQNPIIAALSKSDEGLVLSLLDYKQYVDTSVLNYAVMNSDKVSYRIIRDIATTLKETVGKTGLDPLVENALFGRSEKVIELLSEKEKLEMTPDEKLAFFFSAAFCDSSVLEKFIELGADIFMKTTLGRTILDVAETYENKSIIEYAEKNGLYV